MAVIMKKSQVNHLRRLLGWVRCSRGVFMTPDEIVNVVKENAEYCGEPSEDGKQRLLEWHREAEAIPKYVRDAIRMLEPLVREAEGNIVDAELKKNELPRTMLPNAAD